MVRTSKPAKNAQSDCLNVTTGPVLGIDCP